MSTINFSELEARFFSIDSFFALSYPIFINFIKIFKDIQELTLSKERCVQREADIVRVKLEFREELFIWGWFERLLGKKSYISG